MKKASTHVIDLLVENSNFLINGFFFQKELSIKTNHVTYNGLRMKKLADFKQT